MNKPRGRRFAKIAGFVQVKHWNWASMELRKQFGMRPFIFVLPDSIDPNSTRVQTIWVWPVTREPGKIAGLVVADDRLHFFDFSPTYRAMLGPVLVTLAFFVFFPVLHFAIVATHTFPVRVAAIFHTPDVYCMSRNEGANRRFGSAMPMRLYSFGDLMFGRFAQIPKPLLVRGLHPLLRGNSVDVRVGVLVSHTMPRIRFCHISIHDFWQLTIE